jgi:hypothetical protein
MLPLRIAGNDRVRRLASFSVRLRPQDGSTQGIAGGRLLRHGLVRPSATPAGSRFGRHGLILLLGRNRHDRRFTP